MSPPLLLDLDGSLLGLDQGTVVPLRAWQEAIRFGCGRRIWREFGHSLRAALPAKYGTVLCGSGDFHHVSHLLLSFQSPPRPIDVVVLDNHPDNMRFPFGIHCGSWVRHAAELPQVRRIHVVGITSPDVGLGHPVVEQHRPLGSGVLTLEPGIGNEFSKPHLLPRTVVLGEDVLGASIDPGGGGGGPRRLTRNAPRNTGSARKCI